MKKKILLALSVTLFCIMAFANITASAETYGYLTYEIYDGEVTITDCNELATGRIVIPDTIDGYPVTSIGYDAFYWCTSLTSITIPDSVTFIESSTFSSCTSLTSIIIPDSVIYIGGYAFNVCDNLTDVYYGGTEEDWAKIAIGSNNDPLINATIHFTEEVVPEEPESPDVLSYLTYTISNGEVTITYCNYSATGRIVIPDTIDGYPVTSIGDEAFQNCSRLTSITIPDSVTYIGSNAFYGCFRLTNITIPDSVTSIGACAFYYCPSLTSINIPDSVTYIGYSAFADCTSLTSIIIPDSVTYIEYGAFMSCFRLTNITIPDSVTSIGDRAFNGCDNLTDVYYGGTEEDWAKITIGSNNALLNATIHFTEEVVPEEPVPEEPVPEEPVKILGDLNGDGEVDVRDVIFLRRYIVGGYGIEIK